MIILNQNIELKNTTGLNLFIAKYNNNGDCQWAEVIEGYDKSIIRGITLDEVGNIYITGDFDSFLLSFTNDIYLYKEYQTNAFIAKFNWLGECQWAKSIKGDNVIRSRGIVLDKIGNIFIAGYFTSKIIEFSEDIKIGIVGEFDSFLAKYNNDGECQWVETIIIEGYVDVNFSSPNIAFLLDISIDKNDNLYVGGIFTTPIKFNNNIKLGDDVIFITRKIFIAKFNSEGSCLWAEQISGYGNVDFVKFSVDLSGNIYFVGNFDANNVVFNNGFNINNNYTMKEFQLYESFVAKYNTDGICQWIDYYSVPNLVENYAVTVNDYGHFFVCGYMGNSTLTLSSGLSHIGHGIFLVKYFDNTTSVHESFNQNNDFDFMVKPNPFNNELELQFFLDIEEYINIQLYDISGKLVKSLYEGHALYGTNKLNFIINDLPNGSYHITLSIKDKIVSKKAISMK